MKLSVIILSKNEEEDLKKTLDSVAFADEVIVIDNLSTDDTAAVAEKHKAIVYKRKLENDFSRQRNFGLEKARGDWILFIDADEIITDLLQKEIKSLMQSTKDENSAYYIKRRDFWWGKELKHGEVKKVRNKGLVRLVRRNSGKWLGVVHEVFITSGSIGRLNGFIDHYPHKTVSEFLNSINFYSTLRAKELVRSGKGVSTFSILSYPIGKFFTTYIFKMGFLDGVAGFAYSFLMSFHSFLVRAKQYQYSKLD